MKSSFTLRPVESRSHQSGAFEEGAAFLRRDRLYPDNHIEELAAVRGWGLGHPGAQHGQAIEDRNGNIIIDLS